MIKVSEVKLIYKNHIKPSDRIFIKEPDDAFRAFWDTWDLEVIEHIEEMKMLLLNRSNHVLGVVSISRGGTSGTVIDIKLILQYALKANAHGIILAHNHPSGNLKPSEADIKITERVKEACKVVELTFLDHLIVTPDGTWQSIE
jgi:DNA repair protein RadC